MKLYLVVRDSRGATDTYEPFMLVSWDTETLSMGGFEGVRKGAQCYWTCWEWIPKEVNRLKGAL